MMKATNRIVTGVILAGGRSRRMGTNKALIRLRDEEIIAHVIRQMQVVTDELLLITNTPDLYAHLGLPMHADITPNMGALGGIHAGLTYAINGAALCVGCDMPLLQPNLLSYLIDILGEYDAVVPYVREAAQSASVYQTLTAVYSKRCLPVIDQMLTAGELRVHALYDRISVRIVEPDEWRQFDSGGLSFFNINTPQDFAQAEQVLGVSRT
ncbi:MAG: molybdenum cofactor guanylyltransferase [Candidatus Poribacteria bacterium]|nr:molybdenum cofactor guanylyltransferase [Candidatus Poribacteria bacterium]